MSLNLYHGQLQSEAARGREKLRSHVGHCMPANTLRKRAKCRGSRLPARFRAGYSALRYLD